jgi:DNA polymerase epsilon subunit 4
MDQSEGLAGGSCKDGSSCNDVDSAQDESEQEEEKSEKILRLPFSRVKHIMKIDPDVHLASQEAVFLITKSTVSIDARLNTTNSSNLCY